MHNDTEPLTPTQVAAIIFRKPRPSLQEVAYVRQRFESGEIPTIDPEVATDRRLTTIGYLAGYLADRALRKDHGGPTKVTPPLLRRGEWSHLDERCGPPYDDTLPSSRYRGEAQLRTVYTEVLRDYFSAIVFRRNAQRAGKMFRRSVVVGQAFLLICIAFVATSTIRHFWAGPTPEQAAIQAWIERDAGKHSILRWHGPLRHEEGVAMQVRYRYFSSGRKGIETERQFILSGGQVVRVDSDW